MDSASLIRLVLGDRQEIFREGLKAVLSGMESITVVGEAGDESALLAVLQTQPADIVLLDLDLSPTTDPQIINHVRTAEEARVIVMTPGHDNERLRKALQLGADGFLLRDVRPGTLLDALRTVSDGHQYVEPELAASLVGLSLPKLHQVRERLTVRQLTILELLIRGLGNRRIASETGLSETTVKSELRFIYAELRASNRAEAAAIALRIGLVD